MTAVGFEPTTSPFKVSSDELEYFLRYAVLIVKVNQDISYISDVSSWFSC